MINNAKPLILVAILHKGENDTGTILERPAAWNGLVSEN